MTPLGAGSYRYFGVLLGKAKAVLALLSVSLLPHSHAAVWLGASSPNAHVWVQAGIEEMSADAQPFAYIEIGRDGWQRSLREWPVGLGQRLHVRLIHRGSRWRVVIGGHASRFVYVPHASTITALETQSGLPVSVVAYVDGRLVRSP